MMTMDGTYFDGLAECLKAQVAYYNTHSEYTKEQFYQDWYGGRSWYQPYKEGHLDKFLRPRQQIT